MACPMNVSISNMNYMFDDLPFKMHFKSILASIIIILLVCVVVVVVVDCI